LFSVEVNFVQGSFESEGLKGTACPLSQYTPMIYMASIKRLFDYFETIEIKVLGKRIAVTEDAVKKLVTEVLESQYQISPSLSVRLFSNQSKTHRANRKLRNSQEPQSSLKIIENRMFAQCFWRDLSTLIDFSWNSKKTFFSHT
jgi:hypothetical protein